MNHAPLVVLVVEDNPGDVMLLGEAVEQTGIPIQLLVVEDGEEAMDFLCRRGTRAGAPRPDLIVLDLNLPRKSGREVLAELTAAPALQGIPVAVLTTSKSEADVCGSCPGVRCRHFVMTGEFRHLVRIVRDMVAFARPAAATSADAQREPED